MKDYRDKIIGEFPEPEDRLQAKDFPPEDRLFVYGTDFPLPETMGELRCRYNTDDKFPLVLTDLAGYKVPPLGMTSVYVTGGGGKMGFAYKPGTFRENKYTIGKELGISNAGAIAIREDNRTKAMIDGIRKSFDKHGIEIRGKDSPAVLGAMAKVAMDKVFDDASAREARMFVELMYKILGTKEEQKERREDKAFDLAGQSMAAVQQVLDYTEKMMDKGEVVDGEFLPPED